ncbi:MAG: 4Fe-4S binding protein [Thermoplasmata archaeon]|nr:MAG: 4Fe-4S binding protein [Thermoplasmata archaeon]
MVQRNIIKIDKSLCNGCTLCVKACTEGALEMVDGFAKLIDEKYCDGFGACISECQPGALKIEQREAAPFDEKAAEAHREQQNIKEENNKQINWPIKLNLVSAEAPFFKNSEIYIVSDCVPFAMKNFHDTILKDKSALIVSCPKFDSIESHRDKLKKIIENSNPKSITVVQMEIPCCNDIYKFVENVIESSKMNVPCHKIIVGLDGSVKIIY